MNFGDLSTLPELIRSIGYIGVFLIVFVESGVPIGVILPLPGDTLLFAAGLLVATSAFNIIPLLVAVVAGAILGNSAGYWFGKKFGSRIFSKEQGLFLNRKHLERAERFFEKYGRGALIIARFVPFLRTVVPIFAGVGSMRYSVFLAYNVIGSLLWGAGITALGYFLGSVIPDIDAYLLPILFVIIVLSGLPIVREVLKARAKEPAA